MKTCTADPITQNQARLCVALSHTHGTNIHKLSVFRVYPDLPNTFGGKGLHAHCDHDGKEFPTAEAAWAFALTRGYLRPWHTSQRPARKRLAHDPRFVVWTGETLPQRVGEVCKILRRQGDRVLIGFYAPMDASYAPIRGTFGMTPYLSTWATYKDYRPAARCKQGSHLGYRSATHAILDADDQNQHKAVSVESVEFASAFDF